MDPAHARAAANQMRGFISAANEGGFTVTEEAGDAMIKALRELQYELNSSRTKFEQVERGTPLGTSPAGLAAKEFNKLVASGDQQSAVVVINSLLSLVPQTIEAIEKSKQSYRETDESNASGLRA